MWKKILFGKTSPVINAFKTDAYVENSQAKELILPRKKEIDR